MRSDQRRGLHPCIVGIVRLHPKEDEIHRADVGRGVCGRSADDELVENVVVGDFAQCQAIGADGVEMRPARNEGHVFTRDQLIEAVWGFDYEGDPRTVDVHVRRIRRAIGDSATQPRYLHTVHGLGYKLSAPTS